MRPTATAALIVTVGLIVAACGGDGATAVPVADPTPAAASSEPTEAPGATEGVTVTDAPVAGATDAPAQPSPGSTPVPEFAKKAAHTSEDDPNATYGLVSGRYRLAWDTPPDDAAEACERVEVAVVQQDGDFEYVKASTSARFNSTVNDLPQGTYKLEQRDPACPIWQLRIDWMTN